MIKHCKVWKNKTRKARLGREMEGMVMQLD
jgi:hypothetical protein